MKKFLFTTIAIFFLCACGGDKQAADRISLMIATYSMEGAASLQEFALQAFDVVRRASDDNLSDVARDGFYAVVDKKLQEFKKGHFVELRTVLYESAAVAYAKAENVRERDAISELLKYCSAAVYIDGQRVCDPPAAVRERYEQAKEKAMRQAN